MTTLRIFLVYVIGMLFNIFICDLLNTNIVIHIAGLLVFIIVFEINNLENKIKELNVKDSVRVYKISR